MSDHEKIQMLSQRLEDIERRNVPNWQRPIVDVARQALEQEIATLGRQISRWQRHKKAS